MMDKKKKSYDLYKCYGLLKLMQERQRIIDMLLKEVVEELNCSSECGYDLDLYHEDKDITIEDVKKKCDYFLNRE